MKRPLLITVTAVFFSAVCLSLQAGGKQGISYSEYVTLIRTALPEITKNRLQVDRAKNNLDGSYSAGDINLKGGGSWSSKQEYTYSTGDTNSSKIEDYAFSAGVSKKFTDTGTTVEAAVGHDTITTEGNGTQYYPSVYVKFSQSVLKNTFGVIDRYAKKNAEMKLEIEKVQQSENNKTTLNYYRKLYFFWIELSERLDLLAESIRYAEVIENDTDKKYRAGLCGVEDLYNAQALAAQYRIRYEDLASERTGVEAEINTLLGTGYSPVKNEFEAMYKVAGNKEFMTVTFAKTQNAEIYRLTRNRLIYTMDVNSNSLLPDLDIVGQYTRKSTGDEFTSSYRGLNDSDYYLGFTVSYPLWNTEAESDVRESEIAIEEINTQYRISENAYKVNLEKLTAEKESLKKKISLSESRIKALEARYKTVYKKYRQGNQSLQQVIDALQDVTSEKTVLFQYRSSMIQCYIDYVDLTI